MSTATAGRHPPGPGDVIPRLIAGLRPTGAAVSLAEHHAYYGELPPVTNAASLIQQVHAAGLQGRGGASFPTATKMAAVASSRRRPIVVANGAEGEPLSGKDKLLLRQLPHLVLDGATIAAKAVDAREAIIVVSTSALRAAASIRAALSERERYGVDDVALNVQPAPDGFIVGEESALVHWLNGGPAKPTFTPPRPYQRGVRGAPTLVQNAETLCNLALIARFGPAWFRAIGDPRQPGSALVTLAGAVKRRGIFEIALGLPIASLVEQAEGAAEPLQAFLVGGFFGSWVPAKNALGLRLVDADLASVGAALGARALIALPERSCGVIETARVARYLADQSAGQCGPCVHGLEAIATALEQCSRGVGRSGQLAQIRRWGGQVSGRGACRHPDGAARFVTSALTVFEHEFLLHAQGRCTGAVEPILPITARNG